MTTTHICIVSERLIPNLVPLLMLRPQRVALVSSTEMSELGLTERLEGVLRERRFETVAFDGLPSGGLARITGFAEGLVGRLHDRFPGDRLVLNLTGGNKLMTIGFLQVLGRVVDRVIYTDTANDVLEELPCGDGRTGEARPLSGVVDVPLYLAAQGMALRGCDSTEADWTSRVEGRRDLTRHLADHAHQLGPFIGAINRLANRALDTRGETLTAPVQRFDSRPRGRWAEALRRIDSAGLARWDGGSKLTLADQDAARYLGGGWLEEYAWLSARALGPDDVRLGVEGDWEDTRRGRNELDLVVAHRNRLLVIECKTLRLGRDLRDDAALIYKLDSVGDDVRGLFGQMVLLSARAPSGLILDRAAHHRIQVIGPDRLTRLQQDIRHWMETGRFPPA